MNQPKSKAWAVKTNSAGCITSNCPMSTTAVQNLLTNTQIVNVTKPTVPPPPSPPPSTITGIGYANVDMTNITVYPSPFEKEISIFCPNKEFSGELTVKDIYGKDFKRQSIGSNVKINLEDLSKGIYFVSIIKNSRTIFIKKIIKE